MWDPEIYRKFEQERARPFFDLVAQLPAGNFQRIADLGCGPGHLTRQLADRWPEARVVGVDNSETMLAAARRLSIPGRLDFVAGDIASWEPGRQFDLIISNAALQWLPSHEDLLPRLIAFLAPGGTLAVQVPDFMSIPVRTAIQETVQCDRWRATLAGAGLQPGCVQPLRWYARELLQRNFQVTAWETTYIHVLPGDNPVLDWIKGSALRPYLERLAPEAANEFLAEVGRRVRAAYPPERGITLFPFPRLFFVATRCR